MFRSSPLAEQVVRVLLAIWLILSITSPHGAVAIRAKRSTLITDDDDDTTIRTELVDRNNRQEILAMFNLTEAEMSRIFAGNNDKEKESSGDARNTQYFDNIKEYRINDIRNRLNNAFKTGNSDESQEHPLHEMAAYPTCNSESTEYSWLHDNNVTIQFAHSLFETKRDNLNLDSAILRLYKINPNGTEDSTYGDSGSEDVSQNSNQNQSQKPKRCTDPFLDSQIRVTVSIVQQLRRNKRGAFERKKRICNTIMMNVSKTGWVEIDIKRAIYIWESVGRQSQQQQQQNPLQQQLQTRAPVLVGWLMIEVHDEEEQPLKPGLFFKPPNCNQADLAIPWNYYRPHSSMSPFAAHEVPRYPRLDVKLIGYASFVPNDFNINKQLEKQYANLKRKLFNLTKKSHERDNESTTFVTPTADNQLEESSALPDFEMQQHNHHKRHLQQQHFEIQQQETESHEKNFYENKHWEQYQNQHQHQHSLRHNNHHHHHHHHHHQHQQHQHQHHHGEEHVAKHHQPYNNQQHHRLDLLH